MALGEIPNVYSSCLSVMLTSLANRSSNQAIPSPKFSKTCSVVSSVEYISWVRPCLLIEYKVIICGFIENHGNPMLLHLQIMAMLTWKEMPCVENLQIAYCANCRNADIPGYCCQRSVFCYCYRNMGHFLCSVERIKRFVNVHLHCIQARRQDLAAGGAKK